MFPFAADHPFVFFFLAVYKSSSVERLHLFGVGVGGGAVVFFIFIQGCVLINLKNYILYLSGIKPMAFYLSLFRCF